MDDTERTRFLATLRTDEEFRAAVRRESLSDELLNLPQTVTALVDAIAQQRQDFTALAASVRTYMERTITLIGEGFTAFRGEFTDLRGEFTDLRGEFTELRADVSAGFTSIAAKFDEIDADIQDIKDQRAS